jgi:hypothetical protein
MPNIEFLQALGVHLSSGPLLTLLVVQSLGEGRFYLSDVAKAVGATESSIRKYLRELMRRGHLVFLVKKTSLPGPNYEILWVRRTLEDEPPSQYDHIRARRAKEIVVYHPRYGRKVIAYGEIRKFATQHSLSYQVFRKVLKGDIGNHRGWMLGV